MEDTDRPDLADLQFELAAVEEAVQAAEDADRYQAAQRHRTRAKVLRAQIAAAVAERAS